MIGATDYAGIAAVIAALTGLVTAVGVIVTGLSTRRALKTTNGQPIGRLVENAAITHAVELGLGPPAATDALSDHESSSGSTTSPSSG